MIEEPTILIRLSWNDLPKNTWKNFGVHQISLRDGRIHVFGNSRDFPVPSGWRLVDAHIGLVDTDPNRSRMPLPHGRVDVVLPSGALLLIDELVPGDVDIVKVMTPHMSGGVSNWAGIQLVFEPSTTGGDVGRAGLGDNRTSMEPTDEERAAFKSTTIHCQDEVQLAIVTAYLDRAFAAKVTAPIDDPKVGEYDRMWISGRDLEEDFSIGEPHETREGAIADAVDMFAEGVFQTARIVYKREVPPCPFDAAEAVERSAENASHEWWEGALEGFEDAASKHHDDLDARLDKVWEEWCEAHGIYLEGYTTSELQSHQVGVDDAELEPVLQ